MKEDRGRIDEMNEYEVGEVDSDVKYQIRAYGRRDLEI